MTDIDHLNIRRLDFGLLLIFRELLRQGRTTAVAERLGLSQSAVSHALSRLRDLLGEPLFVRRTDGLQPTAAALALAPQVDALIELAGCMLTASRRFDPVRSDRSFRIATNDFVATFLAPPLLAHLADAAPAMRFGITFAAGKQVFADLSAGRADLAVGRFDAFPGEIRATRLGDERYAIAARAGHHRLRDGLDLETYLDLDHILVSFTGDRDGTADRALTDMGRSRRIAATVPMFLTALATAAAGDAVTTVPRRLAQRYAPVFGLELHEPPFTMAAFPLHIVYHMRDAGDPAIAWFIEQIESLWSQSE